MYSLSVLDRFTALSYQKMTFPAFRPLLGAIEPQGSIVAVGASSAGKPVGLALAAMEANGRTAEILSLFVQADSRNLGIGTSLLVRSEQVLSDRGCQEAQIVYLTGKATTPALEHLLDKRRWSPPVPRMIVCQGDTKILEAPWIEMYETLPPSFAVFPWCELTDGERRDLQRRQEESPWIPEGLVPFQHEENLEPLTSFGLRYQGEVVGWLITHRIDPDTLRYTCDWVREDLQKTGCLLTLHVKAMRRQARAKIPKAIWTVPLQFSKMVKFEEYARPYLASMAETRGSFKRLVDGGPV